eukprot:scaffold426741_cov33-Prasinocladus_malaysianus.AAC.2
MVDLEEIVDEPAAAAQQITGPYDTELGDLLIAHEGSTSALMSTVLDFLARRSNVFKDEGAEKRLLDAVRSAARKSREEAAAKRSKPEPRQQHNQQHQEAAAQPTPNPTASTPAPSQ